MLFKQVEHWIGVQLFWHGFGGNSSFFAVLLVRVVSVVMVRLRILIAGRVLGRVKFEGLFGLLLGLKHVIGCG